MHIKKFSTCTILICALMLGITALAHAEDKVSGIYKSGLGSVIISSTSNKIYNIQINTSAGDGKWVCNFEGRAQLQDNVISLKDGPAYVRIKLHPDRTVLEVLDFCNDCCGFNGSIKGVYRRLHVLGVEDSKTFFNDKNQVNMLIDNSIQLGQNGGVDGLIDFSVEQYRAVINSLRTQMNPDEVKVRAKISWYSLVWSKVLMLNSKAGQNEIAEIDNSLFLVGRDLFGWSYEDVEDMFNKTRARFAERIRQQSR